MQYFNNISTFEEAKNRYRTLVKQLHPDKGGSASDFQQMQTEYKSLLLRIQNNELISNSGNTTQSDDIINELGKLAKTFVKSGVPQKFLQHQMNKSKTTLERTLYKGIISLLDDL